MTAEMSEDPQTGDQILRVLIPKVEMWALHKKLEEGILNFVATQIAEKYLDLHGEEIFGKFNVQEITEGAIRIAVGEVALRMIREKK